MIVTKTVFMLEVSVGRERTENIAVFDRKPEWQDI